MRADDVVGGRPGCYQRLMVRQRTERGRAAYEEKEGKVRIGGDCGRAIGTREGRESQWEREKG